VFIIERLKGWALTALAVLLVLVGAYAMGGRASRKAADKKTNYDEALRTAAGAKGVHDVELNTRGMPDGAAADELRRNWMRRRGDTDAKGDSRDTT
jgi:hypothetical protein